MKGLFQTIAEKLYRTFFDSVSMASVYSFTFALAVAVAYLMLRRERRNVRVLRVIVRKLFARKLWLHRSTRLDVALLLFNILLFPIIFVLAVVSYDRIGTGVYGWLGQTFGTPQEPLLPGWISSAIITVNLFVAYELAYYIDHILSHRIPFLWEFHRVHHSASVLTPLTNWRVHPVDSLVFLNLIALLTGSTQAVTHYVLGVQAAPYLVQGENLIFLAYMYIYGHLQHSHIWMTFGNVWSRILMSPAAHQIHHSTNPRHFNRNFGGAMSLWDWVFGTLYLPTDRREVHEVGLDDDDCHDSVVATLFLPFVTVGRKTLGRLLPRVRDRNAGG